LTPKFFNDKQALANHRQELVIRLKTTRALTSDSQNFGVLNRTVRGLAHKRHPQSGGRGVCPVRTCRSGFFRCGCPYLLVQKTLDFSKSMVCSHVQGGRGLSQCRHFVGKVGGGQFFAILCGSPLCTTLTVTVQHASAMR